MLQWSLCTIRLYTANNRELDKYPFPEVTDIIITELGMSVQQYCTQLPQGKDYETMENFIKHVQQNFCGSTSCAQAERIFYNLKQEDDPRVTSLGKRSVIFWVTAVICWINDKLYCEVWSNIGFPYLHGFWHVLIFLASYTAVVLFAYFDVKHNHPHEVPIICYWPKDTFELGIPYVKLKNYHWNKKEHNI